MDSYTDDKGFLATSRKRIEQGRLNMHETEKYGKEYAMCQTLALNGHRIEYLAEVEGQYDITIDGQTADLKKTASHNHVVDYARKAVKRQGAKVVVFEFEKETKEVYKELEALKKRGYRVYFFFTGKNDKLYGF
jgi:hypothetical protein